MDKKVLSALVIFALGLLVGWLVIGWGIWPVEYTNAPMKEVRQEDKLIYLNTLADAFQHNPDPTLARERLKLLGGPEAVRSLTLDAIAQAQAKGDMTAVERMLQLTKAVGLNVAARPGQAVEPAQPGQAEDVAAQPAEKSGGLTLLQICGGSLGVLVLLAGIAIAAWLLWGRQQGGEESDLPAPLPVSDPLAPASSASWDSNDDSPEVVWEDDGGPARSQPTAVSAGGAAMAFTATYNLDESRYDESFDIESTKDGSYLGECGMTVSEEVSSDGGDGDGPGGVALRQERHPHRDQGADERLCFRQPGLAR